MRVIQWRRMSDGLQGFFSLALILGNGFFVLAEYALVSTRRQKMEGLAKKGNRSAKLVLSALDDFSTHVAGLQLGVTMLGIGVGSVAEPFVTESLVHLFGTAIPRGLSFVIAFVLVTFVMVVVGEVVPKYVALNLPDRLALLTIRPLRVFVAVLKPLIFLIERSGAALLRLGGIDVRKKNEDAVSKDELLMLVRSGGTAGLLDVSHAEMISRAVKLDALDADDIMIHRLDIKWLDLATPREELLGKLKTIPHTRVPVCRGDIDDVAGILYLHDLICHWEDPDFDLEGLLRPAVAIPENLSMDKIVARMREAKSQMLVVMDEYGGTSGLVTLEDVVEEVFGELEDRLESERSPIEILPSGRVSARSDVRFDELAAKLSAELETPSTDTLATVIVNGLERVPRPGDSVQTELGLLLVENMARRRITRVSLYPRPDLQRSPDSSQ